MLKSSASNRNDIFAVVFLLFRVSLAFACIDACLFKKSLKSMKTTGKNEKNRIEKRSINQERWKDELAMGNE